MVYPTPYTQLPRWETKSTGSIDRTTRSDKQVHSTPVRFQTTLTLPFKFISNPFPRRGNHTGGSRLKAILLIRYGITLAPAICQHHTVTHVSPNGIFGHRGRNHNLATVPTLKVDQRHRLRRIRVSVLQSPRNLNRVAWPIPELFANTILTSWLTEIIWIRVKHCASHTSRTDLLERSKTTTAMRT